MGSFCATPCRYTLCVTNKQHHPLRLLCRYNPLGKVPTLIYKDEEGIQSMYESLICNQFIHELPGKPLLPEHAAKWAHARIIIDRFSTVISAFDGVRATS